MTPFPVPDYNFDAFTNPLGFTLASALTTYLSPDGVVDAATSFEYQDARWRDGAEWTQMDNITENPGDLVNANLYDYVGSDPINMVDPSGHFGVLDTLAVIGIVGAVFTLGTVGLAIYRNHYGENSGQGFGRNLTDILDSDLTYVPNPILDGGIPESPIQVLERHKYSILTVASRYGIPAELLATVLLTEDRHFSWKDVATDWSDERSIGIAQIRPDTILAHAGKRPDLYPTGIDMATAYDLLKDPDSAIDMLGREMTYIAEDSLGPKINFNDWWTGGAAGNVTNRRMDMVRGFVSAKDTDNYYDKSNYGDTWGMESYQLLQQNHLFDDAPWGSGDLQNPPNGA